MALTARSAHRKDLGKSSCKMEHRHFATIAAAIRELRGFTDVQKDKLAAHFARHLRSTNPNFNSDRFIAACLSAEA